MPENQTHPTLGDLFIEHEPEIGAIFENIIAESDFAGHEAPRLELTEAETTMLFRCVPSKRLVRADWRGIASLWAMSQAVGRLGPALFNARRSSAERLDLAEGSKEELGHHFIGYAKKLSEPQDWRWNSFFPKPDLTAQSEAARTGDAFFFRSIEWILRHELGHIALGHGDSAWSADQSRAEEREADLHATRGIKSDLDADSNRASGAKPSANELELERRALAAGIGLIWVAVYEDTRAQNSDMYPPIADRMFRCLDVFGLAEDSAALEILSDFVKAWIDPEGIWPAKPPAEATAEAAMCEAFGRLDEYAHKLRS